MRRVPPATGGIALWSGMYQLVLNKLSDGGHRSAYSRGNGGAQDTRGKWWACSDLGCGACNDHLGVSAVPVPTVHAHCLPGDKGGQRRQEEAYCGRDFLGSAQALGRRVPRIGCQKGRVGVVCGCGLGVNHCDQSQQIKNRVCRVTEAAVGCRLRSRRVPPGATLFTRVPEAAHSTASVFVMLTTPTRVMTMSVNFRVKLSQELGRLNA